LKFLSRPHWQLALLSGLFLGISYPPLPGITAWLALVPLIHVWLNTSPASAAKWSFMTAITSNLIFLYWLGLNQGAGWLPVLGSMLGAIIYLGIFLTILGFIVAWIQNKKGWGLIILPFLWVTMEYLRGFGPMGFSWANMALTQTKFLALIQMVSYTGTGGLGFWIILLNIGFYLLLTRGRKKRTAFVLIIIFVIPFMTGIIQLKSTDQSVSRDSRKISIVQPNINPDSKWDSAFRSELYTIMDSLHNQALKNNPDLVLWPEVSLPVYLRSSSYQRKKYEDIVKKSGVPLLTGTLDWTKNKKGEKSYYNGSYLIGIEGNQIYRKLFLVPFAEYIPFSNLIPAIKKLNIGTANFSHGEEYTVFNLDSIGFSNVICYESSIPGLMRKFIMKGARFITIEANDAWSGNTSGVYQHFELAKLRAIELRTAIARSGNTGISGIISPSGKVQAYMGFGKQGVLTGYLPLNTQASIYVKYGELFSKICLLFSILILASAWLKP